MNFAVPANGETQNHVNFDLDPSLFEGLSNVFIVDWLHLIAYQILCDWVWKPFFKLHNLEEMYIVCTAVSMI